MRLRQLRLASAALPLVPLALVAGLSACGSGGGEPASPAASTTATQITTTTTAATTTTTTAGQVISVVVRGGQVQGPSRYRVERNETVTVRVASDAADEIHVHGYDKSAPVAAGSTAEVNFVAAIPGVFEVELERSHRLLFTLEVRS